VKLGVGLSINAHLVTDISISYFAHLGISAAKWSHHGYSWYSDHVHHRRPFTSAFGHLWCVAL